MAEAGIRELRNHLSRYLDRVRHGEELVVTDRGTAIARIIPVAHERPLDRLVESGLVELAPESARARPRPATDVDGPLSDFVASQRR